MPFRAARMVGFPVLAVGGVLLVAALAMACIPHRGKIEVSNIDHSSEGDGSPGSGSAKTISMAVHLVEIRGPVRGRHVGQTTAQRGHRAPNSWGIESTRRVTGRSILRNADTANISNTFLE